MKYEQVTKYDFCSIMQYKAERFNWTKVDKWRGLGCTTGQARFPNSQPSVLDFQKLNTMYQCNKKYGRLDTCADYFKYVVLYQSK